MFKKSTPPAPTPPTSPLPPDAPTDGADQARANHAKGEGAEDDAAGHASKLHDQGKAHGAKHGC